MVLRENIESQVNKAEPEDMKYPIQAGFSTCDSRKVLMITVCDFPPQSMSCAINFVLVNQLSLILRLYHYPDTQTVIEITPGPPNAPSVVICAPFCLATPTVPPQVVMI